MSFRIYTDAVFAQHHAEGLHPESPERLSKLNFGPSAQPVEILPCRRTATPDDLLLAHTERHIHAVQETMNHPFSQFDADTYACSQSYEVACKAVGTMLDAVDALHTGTTTRAFALVRPPGHHAEKDRAMGFCLFNNIAIAAAHAISEHGYKKIAIYDFDVHHGNGTQNIFYHRPDLLYLSHHQFPFYPGTGDWNETGIGEGSGMTVNCPLPKGSGNAEVLFIWDTIFRPILEQYQPQLLLLSAGYDAHESDPLGQMRVTDQGYFQLCRRLENFSQTNKVPLLYQLEGGYNPQAVANGVLSAIAAHGTEQPAMALGDATSICKDLLSQARNTLTKFWRL